MAELNLPPTHRNGLWLAIPTNQQEPPEHTGTVLGDITAIVDTNLKPRTDLIAFHQKAQDARTLECAKKFFALLQAADTCPQCLMMSPGRQLHTGWCPEIVMRETPPEEVKRRAAAIGVGA